MVKKLGISMLLFMLINCVFCASAQTECSNVHPDVTILRSQKGLQPVADVSRLTSLIEERLTVMIDVARAKWNTGSAIEDPLREQQLLADVAAQAQKEGIPTGWAQHFFRLQIEAAKEVQYCLFAQWAARKQSTFQQVPDLKSDLRPKLDRLTADLLAVLARQWPDLQTLSSTGSGKPFKQSGGAAAIHLALLPLWDGSLQAQDVGRAKDVH
jgi:chorismate mutase-like protein